jgi:hypothetical protein
MALLKPPAKTADIGKLPSHPFFHYSIHTHRKNGKTILWLAADMSVAYRQFI